MNKRLHILVILACALSLAPVASSLAQDDIEDGGERCIDTRRIANTYVADAENIIFYMRGGQIYRNTLPRKCNALVREKSFSYKTSMSRLCSIDTITVIYNYGSGISSGPSCGLGSFHPINKEEAQALREGPDADIEPEPIKPADPEQPEIPTPREES